MIPRSTAAVVHAFLYVRLLLVHITMTTTTGSSVMAMTNPTNTHSLNRRQACLQGTTLGWSVAAGSAAASTTSTSQSPLEAPMDCSRAVLAPEQAVPGAYQQACMQESVRVVPVHGTPLTIAQRPPNSLAGSTGTVVWNSSLLLVRLLERLYPDNNNTKNSANPPPWTPPTLTADTTVLEVGCGTGLASVAAATLGAGHVVATDGNPDAVALAALNLKVNTSNDNDKRISNIEAGRSSDNKNNSTREAVSLQWGIWSAMEYAGVADLVLGSDLTYYSGNWPALAETLSTVLRSASDSRNGDIGGGRVLYLSLGHAGFNVEAEMDGFLAVAASSSATAAGGMAVEADLTRYLLEECVTLEERRMIQSSGGVRVVVLRNR